MRCGPIGDDVRTAALHPTARADHERDADCAVGVDVGGDAAWLVALTLDATPSVLRTLLVHPLDDNRIVDFCRSATCVAIDAPAAASTAPHAGDTRLAAKFQRARCGEVALRRQGIAVPWVTPMAGAEVPSWISAGYRIWGALEQQGLDLVETYPHGVFWRLTGAPVLHKQRPAGHLLRIAALQSRLCSPPELQLWSHDGVDSLAAALVAWFVAKGRAERIDCATDDGWAGHDGSAIWLPPRVAGSGADLVQS